MPPRSSRAFPSRAPRSCLAAELHHLDAGTAALLVNIAPILVAVVFGDGFPRPLVAGLAVALIGVLIIATWVGCAAGLLATTPFAGQAITELSHAPARATLGVIFLGVGPTAIAFLTWAYALARTDAGRMAATTLCVPALAVVLSWATLGEVPTTWGLIGGALALAGVAISRRPVRQKSPNTADHDMPASPASTSST